MNKHTVSIINCSDIFQTVPSHPEGLAVYVKRINHDKTFYRICIIVARPHAFSRHHRRTTLFQQDQTRRTSACFNNVRGEIKGAAPNKLRGLQIPDTRCIGALHTTGMSSISNTVCHMFFVSFWFLFSCAIAHGILTDPRQRGALRLDNHLVPTIDWDAPQDYASHFPSGSKSTVPGAGTESVRRAAGNNWTPYQPLDRFFHWRAGVCGDDYNRMPQDHLMGGRYYHNAYRVREYIQGSILFIESEIVAHHNGFFEFYICNIDTCGNDISELCFHDGHCQQLLRTPGSCDKGNDMRCGPIDPMNPGRWYLPCVVSEPMMMGGWSRTIAYTLPRDLVCDHCVIQWYWTAANSCNNKGIEEYFTSPFAPNWGDCPGQGGARGGWAKGKPECGGDRFPEEYWQCADIRIVPNPAFATPPQRPPLPPPPRPPTALFPFGLPNPILGQSSAGAGEGSMVVTADGSVSQASGLRGDGADESLEEGQQGSADERGDESSVQDNSVAEDDFNRSQSNDEEEATEDGEVSTNESVDSLEQASEQEIGDQARGEDAGSASQSSDQESLTVSGEALSTESVNSGEQASEEESGTGSEGGTGADEIESQAISGEQSLESESPASDGSAVDALGIHHSQV